MANKNLAILPGAFEEIYVRNWKCDEEMSDSSTAPVQNKVIKEYVDNSLNNIPDVKDIQKELSTVKEEVQKIKDDEYDKIIYF